MSILYPMGWKSQYQTFQDISQTWSKTEADNYDVLCFDQLFSRKKDEKVSLQHAVFHIWSLLILFQVRYSPSFISFFTIQCQCTNTHCLHFCFQKWINYEREQDPSFYTKKKPALKCSVYCLLFKPWPNNFKFNKPWGVMVTLWKTLHLRT